MGELVSVLTAKGPRDFVHDGGSGWWVLDPARALRAEYLAIVHNSGFVEYDLLERGPGPHNHITLVGRKLSIVGSGVDEKSQEERHCIGFKEYAWLPTPIHKPWASGKNPVRYYPTDQVGIDFDALDWRPFSELVPEDTHKAQDWPEFTTIELVQMLAKRLNKSPDVIMQKLMA